ncbi:unnamed protein product [Cochlearia groenlandica]
MSSQSFSGSIPLKSKKRLSDSPCSISPSSVALLTPEKSPENILTRSRKRSVALSLKEIRQAAGSRRRSENPIRMASSAKRKLVFLSSDSSSSSSSSSKRICTNNKNAEQNQLPEKRFSYSHLAQLKHILPEAIEIKRVLIYDETTNCMKPDLHVTLNADAVEDKDKSKPERERIVLRKLFRERLYGFVKAHPQGDEVPEEPLPELFNRRKADEVSKDEVKCVGFVMKEMACIPSAKLISSLFKVTSSPVKTASIPDKQTSSQIVPGLPNVPLTPAKTDFVPVIFASTPLESSSTPVRLFSTSLAKRSSGYMSQDDASTDRLVKLARRSSLSSRSLNFDSYTEDKKAMDVIDDEDNDEVQEEDVSSDDQILSILHNKLRQSIKEQERKAMEDQDPAISQAKRRRKMIACLPKLFNVIHYLIQSIRRWIITKEELVHKIIAGHSDITDRSDVEEQLVLMQELVPEWIYEKRSSSGDLLVCINKLASPQTIRSCLEKENKKVCKKG